MNEKLYKWLNWGLALVSIFSLTMFILISTERWRVHDDWLFVVRMNKMGLIPFCVEYYNTWDARFIFPVFIAYWAFIKYVGFKATLIFCSICFIACNFILIKIVNAITKLNIKPLQLMIATSVSTFAVWYSMRVVMVDTLYWMTAGVYIFTLLVNLLWLYAWVINDFTKNKIPLWFYLLTFCIATSTQNISVGLAFIAFITIIYNKSLGIKFKSNQLYILIVICIIGIGISTFSSGSMQQFNGEISSNYGLEEKANFTTLASHWVKLYIDALTSLGLLFYVCIFGLALVIYGLTSKNKFTLNLGILLPTKINFKVVVSHIYTNKFLYAAFWTLLIYWPTPLLSPRYYIGFYFYFILFILLKTIKVNKEENYTNQKTNLIGATIASVFLFMSILIYKNAYSNSKLMNNFRAERDIQMGLYSNKASKLLVPGFMDNSCPILVKSEEISDDSTYIYNLILQDYHKIKTIKSNEFVKWNQLVENKNRMKEFVKERVIVEKWQK